MRLSALVLVLSTAIATPAAAQDRRPMGVVDMIALPAVSDPQLSPDGTMVLFVMDGPDWKANRRVGHVFRIRADGSDQVQLTFGERGESSPRWSPDGRRIAFVDRATDVVVVGPEGERRLETDRDLVGTVSWSPGGKEILVASGDPGRPFVVIDTGAPVLRGRPLPLAYPPGSPPGVPQWGPATPPLDPAPPGRYGTALDRGAVTDASATLPD